jgi:integrase
MATIRRRGARWHVQVRRSGGHQATRSFLRRSDADRWARETEAAADRWAFGFDPAALKQFTLADLLDRYRNEITPLKRGQRRELQLLRAFGADSLALRKVGEVTASLIATYRDARLQQVAPATVRRELALLAHVFEVARKDWGLPLAGNPVRGIRQPAAGASRIRRVASDELHRLLGSLRADNNPLLGPAILFAIETGLRRGELLSARWEDIDGAMLQVPETKNGHPRVIALSPVALQVLDELRSSLREPQRIFPMSANALRLAWERLKRRAGIEDLRFHDLRHEAISRLFEKGLNVPEVAVMSGHRDPRMLFRYTHPRPEDIARKLAAAT